VSLYGDHILPRITDLVCGVGTHRRQREKIVPQARGRVLEIGLGSGLNLAHYDANAVDLVWGVDPSAGMSRLAESRIRDAPFEVRVLQHTADDIPLDDDSADSAVITYTLCSIPDPERALKEIARVLKPGATLLFCEHGAAPDASVRRWQNRLTPYWKHVAGGCHLDRDIPAILRQGGFKVQGLETMYLPGWRPGTFNFWGSATP
jgi:ubiquinone/menaquinone biosynthesis C-methylase UbiE